MREEVLIEQFTAMLADVSLNERVLGWLTRALRESSNDIKGDHDRAVARLEADLGDIRHRMKELYRDQQSGKIDDHIFRLLYADYQEDERKVIRELKRHADAEVENLDDAVTLLRAAKDARHLFGRSDLATKRHLLTTLLSNFSWRDRTLSASFRKPFDIIIEKFPRGEVVEGGKGAKMPKSGRWLPGPDSNRRPFD